MSIKFLNHMPLTKEGADLDLTDEQKEVLKIVYRPSEKNPDDYVFHEFWNPEKEYADEYVAIPLESVYGGLTDDEFLPGITFVNVIGSTNDPKPLDRNNQPYKSWRQLMKAVGLPNYNTCCAETDVIYDPETGSVFEGFECTNGGNELPNRDYREGIWMHGAHVLMNETDPKGFKGNSVYMLPLCKDHNTYDRVTNSYGTGYYMKLRRRQKAIILNAYVPKKLIVQVLEMENPKEEEA